MLSGSTGAGLNPEMLTLGMLILFAGRAAYVFGVDRFLLPWLKTSLSDRRHKTVAPRPVPIAH